MSGSVYENPLCTRYAGKNMQRIFSDDNRYGIWRRLWLALAKGEKALGLEITEQMISEMESNLDNIDYETVARREKRCGTTLWRTCMHSGWLRLTPSR